ncbi:MAG TPA: HNH endonuclease [Pyrinomonadaceae bacterium]|nr:HNH endonuclease [Pyrinomonadaceae bacterium]
MAGRLIPQPYEYPHVPHDRRHGPSGWKDYQRYRPWLRDEFAFRCVYCLHREVWQDMRSKMHIDHFQPQSLNEDLISEYSNLLYLCPACNSLKRANLLPDPCAVALGDCLRVHKDGRIEAINDNKRGRLLIEMLALDEPKARNRRRMIIGTILSFAETNWTMFVEWMRYPSDLPDLSQQQNIPPSNSKPEGVAQSYAEMKRRGELPEVY